MTVFSEEPSGTKSSYTNKRNSTAGIFLNYIFLNISGLTKLKIINKHSYTEVLGTLKLVTKCTQYQHASHTRGPYIYIEFIV